MYCGDLLIGNEVRISIRARPSNNNCLFALAPCFLTYLKKVKSLCTIIENPPLSFCVMITINF